MIRLARTGTVFSGSGRDLERLRQQFDQQHWVRWLELIELELLRFILDRIEQASFSEFVHGGLGVDLYMANPVAHVLHFLANDPKLSRIIQEITGCGRIGCFAGRVYRMTLGSGHYDAWHNDLVDDRLVGMSVNLSPEVYAGGVLEIRQCQSEQVVARVPNPGLGDAILFRLSERLQHRVSEVVGTVPKTVFAGWFKSQPDCHASFRRRGSDTRGVVAPA